MTRSPRRFFVCAGLVLLAAGIAAAQDGPRFAEQLLDGRIVTPAGIFDTWQDYLRSDYFRDNALRCGTRIESGTDWAELGSPADCTLNLTNPLEIYDPAVVTYRIPVVVHVIMNTSGFGFLSEQDVQSQIDILNEDFLAIPGTNGGLGTDVEIQFYLAEVDPDGNPTNGITYSTNNSWYNDGGSYWNTLAWDTHNYLNIYTNTAGGALGYVPALPQGGIVGSKSDRVVILWTAFGRDSAGGPPYDQGRTATHEVGHYIGLYHPFDNGCGSLSSCYTTGDRICDTLPESNPSFGCPAGKATCGDDDPQENYMDYSDDLCMTEFTSEQARRMRCTLEGYRPNLFETIENSCGNGVPDSGEQCDDGNHTPGDGCDFFCRIEAAPWEVSGPASAEPLRFFSPSDLRWEPAEPSRSERFNLYRGLDSGLPLGNYGTCVGNGLEVPRATVAFNPPVGKVWTFLVAGENDYGEGTLGQTSTGAERPNGAPCSP